MAWMYDDQKQEKWASFVQTLNPEIDPRAMNLIDEMGFVSRAVHFVAESNLEDAGLSFAQYKILMHLFFAEQTGDEGAMYPSEISSRHRVSRNTISTLIANLEDAGLVRRKLDTHDRRRFNISLTQKGRRIVSDHARRHLSAVGSCFNALTPDEQETLYRLLRKVRTRVNELRNQLAL